MIYTSKIKKAALAIGLIGSLVGGVATSAVANAATTGVHYYEPGDNGSTWSFYPGYTDGSTAQPRVRHSSALDAHAEVRGHTGAGAIADNPPGSSFQSRGNAESMGCPC
jgi:hypothetical protein